jgi:hypothetical protein
MLSFPRRNLILPLIFILSTPLFFSCSHSRTESKEEHLRIKTQSDSVGVDTSQLNSINGNATWNQIMTNPQNVILTGLKDHRLVTVYKKVRPEQSRSYNYFDYQPDFVDGRSEHFMPGIDVIFGYNLIRVAHYDLKKEELNFLFDEPVLVKSLYFPSYKQDSLDNKPINRDYYLLSVYDGDTNQDSLLNRKDLRRFYYFNAAGTGKTQLIPGDYSVFRSEYDPANDVMYIFCRHDANKDGMANEKEPIHIFWIDLKAPAVAKRLY